MTENKLILVEFSDDDRALINDHFEGKRSDADESVVRLSTIKERLGWSRIIRRSKDSGRVIDCATPYIHILHPDEETRKIRLTEDEIWLLERHLDSDLSDEEIYGEELLVLQDKF